MSEMKEKFALVECILSQLLVLLEWLAQYFPKHFYFCTIHSHGSQADSLFSFPTPAENYIKPLGAKIRETDTIPDTRQKLGPRVIQTLFSVYRK